MLGDGIDVVISPPADGARADARRRARDAHHLRPARRSSRPASRSRRPRRRCSLRPRARARAAQGAARAATRSPPTAGSSPATCPRSTSHLHYRIIDVSSIKELARRWYPRVYFNCPAEARRPPRARRHPGEHRGAAATTARPCSCRSPARTPTTARRSRAARHRARRRPTDRHARGPRAVTRSGDLYDGAADARPPVPRSLDGGCSSAGRAPGCGPGGRGFKSRHSPQSTSYGDAAGPARRGRDRRRPPCVDQLPISGSTPRWAPCPETLRPRVSSVPVKPSKGSNRSLRESTSGSPWCRRRRPCRRRQQPEVLTAGVHQVGGRGRRPSVCQLPMR